MKTILLPIFCLLLCGSKTSYGWEHTSPKLAHLGNQNSPFLHPTSGTPAATTSFTIPPIGNPATVTMVLDFPSFLRILTEASSNSQGNSENQPQGSTSMQQFQQDQAWAITLTFDKSHPRELFF